MEEIRKFSADVVTKVAEAEVEQSYMEPEVLAECPLCGGEIAENRKAFGCRNWKEKGCKFAIWKRIASRTITDVEAKQLLTEGRTEKLRGFKSKAGKFFEAVLELKDNKVQFVFEERKPNPKFGSGAKKSDKEQDDKEDKSD